MTFETVFLNNLLQYGAMGLFVCYLVYDRQILLKKLINTIDNNSRTMVEVKLAMQSCQSYKRK